MSGHSGVPGREIRAKVGHPIVDVDAHVLECTFAVRDFVREVGGNALLERFDNRPPSFFRTKGIWWGAPSGEHTADRAMSMLPKYFAARMHECGIDFAHMLPSLGISTIHIADEDLRVGLARALNLLYAEMFRDVADRVRPVAVVPTYTPAEAIRELEFAVLECGHKAIMIGTETRAPFREVAEGAPHLGRFAEQRVSLGVDSPYDFDPFWQRCVDLKVAPICHTSGRGLGYRQSPTNYMFNHLGDFSSGAEFFCRSIFLGGVTKRFPTLNFGFLEGGVAWAVTLLNDIVEHWEKRNVAALERDLDPAKLDVPLLLELFETYGDQRLTRAAIGANPHINISQPGRPELFDEFARSGMAEIADVGKLFCENFFFGCEADDRMIAAGFNRRLNPAGKKLHAMFGSDIGHWDVMDATTILSEAYSLVEAGLIDAGDFRDFTFTNPVRLHLGMNPAYYDGTTIEAEAAKLLAPLANA
jgi:predicted TIM-barrel fold metal-dependent hydrolase